MKRIQNLNRHRNDVTSCHVKRADILGARVTPLIKYEVNTPCLLARQILHPLGYYPLARNASLGLTCCVVYFLSQNGMLFFCGYASFARILTGYDRDSVLCLNDVMSFAPTRGS